MKQRVIFIDYRLCQSRVPPAQLGVAPIASLEIASIRVGVSTRPKVVLSSNVAFPPNSVRPETARETSSTDR